VKEYLWTVKSLKEEQCWIHRPHRWIGSAGSLPRWSCPLRYSQSNEPYQCRSYKTVWRIHGVKNTGLGAKRKQQKSSDRKLYHKVCRILHSAVVFISAALAVIPPLVVPGAGFFDWVYRALIFLVISCPCALVISIPLGFFGGIGGASKNGILIKGSNYLEALNSVDTVVFDKTGTLTKGVFNVTEVNPSSDFTKEDLLKYAAYAESFFKPPIALSITKAFGKTIDKSKVESYEEKLLQVLKIL